MLARKRLPLLGAAVLAALAAAVWLVRPGAGAEVAAARVAAACASRDVMLDDQPHRLVAVCTRTGRETTVNDPGRIDLYLLRQDGADWQPVAQQLGIDSGRLGQPGEVTVLRLGPSVYGFEVDDTAVSQGYLLGSTRVYVPSEGSFRLALDFTSSVKNSGAHECASSTPPACTDLSRRLQVLATDGGASALHPLRITSLGSFRGQPVSTSHVLSYDARQHHYRLPAGFEAHVE